MSHALHVEDVCVMERGRCFNSLVSQPVVEQLDRLLLVKMTIAAALLGDAIISVDGKLTELINVMLVGHACRLGAHHPLAWLPL